MLMRPFEGNRCVGATIVVREDQKKSFSQYVVHYTQDGDSSSKPLKYIEGTNSQVNLSCLVNGSTYKIFVKGVKHNTKLTAPSNTLYLTPYTGS